MPFPSWRPQPKPGWVWMTPSTLWSVKSERTRTPEVKRRRCISWAPIEDLNAHYCSTVNVRFLIINFCLISSECQSHAQKKNKHETMSKVKVVGCLTGFNLKITSSEKTNMIRTGKDL